MPTKPNANITVEVVWEKDTRRYSKYNFPPPFTGSFYLPLPTEPGRENPPSLEVTVAPSKNGQ